MSTDLEDALDNIRARIKEITAAPKPTYTVDGQTVKWGEYLEQLLRAEKQLAEAVTREDGPFEERTQVFT